MEHHRGNIPSDFRLPGESSYFLISSRSWVQARSNSGGEHLQFTRLDGCQTSLPATSGGLMIAELTTAPFARVEIIHGSWQGQEHRQLDWQADSCQAGRLISMFTVHYWTKYISAGMHLLPCQRRIYFHGAEKLRVTQLVNGFPTSYGEKNVRTLLETFQYWSLIYSDGIGLHHNILPLKIHFNTGSSLKMEGIWNRYNLKNTVWNLRTRNCK